MSAASRIENAAGPPATRTARLGAGPALVADGLDVVFDMPAESVRAVRNVSFTIDVGECL
jgi:hypothetical protein